jgi:hypothetical protein
MARNYCSGVFTARNPLLRATPRAAALSLALCTVVAGLLLATGMGVAHAQSVPGEIAAALRSGNVYVSPSARLRLTPEEQAELERFAGERRLGSHASKFLVLDRVPQGFRSLGHLVEAAHTALDLDDSIMVAVVLDTGRGSGSISAKTNALDAEAIQRLQRQALDTFASVGFAEGFKLLTVAMIAESETQRTATVTAVVLLSGLTLTLAAAALGMLLKRAANRWKRELDGTRETVDSLAPLVQRLDVELPLLAERPEGRTLDDLFSQAIDHYQRATDILARLSRLSAMRGALPGPHRESLAEASHHLGVARYYLSDAIEGLDRATGATPHEPEIRLVQDSPSVT